MDVGWSSRDGGSGGEWKKGGALGMEGVGSVDVGWSSRDGGRGGVWT